MIFEELSIQGVYLIDLEAFKDERGSFARVFCQREFSDQLGDDIRLLQINHSITHEKGSLRGMHFQNAPSMEDKLIRCIGGNIYDVVLDIREGSSTFLKWEAVELSAMNRRMIFIPKGCAHGFQALTDGVEMIYHHTAFYDREREGGIAYNDPRINISWPLVPKNISKKDLSYPHITSTFTGLKV